MMVANISSKNKKKVILMYDYRYEPHRLIFMIDNKSFFRDKSHEGSIGCSIMSATY